MYNLQTQSVTAESEEEMEKRCIEDVNEDQAMDEGRGGLCESLHEDSGDEGGSEASSEEEEESGDRELLEGLEFLVSGKRIEEVCYKRELHKT